MLGAESKSHTVKHLEECTIVVRHPIFIKNSIALPCLKYRSRADICTEILKIADRGTSKTKIMYGAYLSFTQLREYLKLLLDNGMLSFDEKTMQYRTTETGHNFIRMYQRIDQMFDRKQMGSEKG